MAFDNHVSFVNTESGEEEEADEEEGEHHVSFVNTESGEEEEADEEEGEQDEDEDWNAERESDAWAIYISSLAFSANGMVMAIGHIDGNLFFRNSESFTFIGEKYLGSDGRKGDAVTSLAFSPVTDTVAALQMNWRLSIVQVCSGEVLHILDSNPSTCSPSQDGTNVERALWYGIGQLSIAVADERFLCIRFVQVLANEIVMPSEMHIQMELDGGEAGGVYANLLAYSPCGMIVALGCADGGLLITGADDPKKSIHTIENLDRRTRTCFGFGVTAESLAFSLSGEDVAVWCSDAHVRIVAATSGEITRCMSYSPKAPYLWIYKQYNLTGVFMAYRPNGREHNSSHPSGPKSAGSLSKGAAAKFAEDVQEMQSFEPSQLLTDMPIQLVYHEEAAAQIDIREADMVVNEMWAQHIHNMSQLGSFCPATEVVAHDEAAEEATKSDAQVTSEHSEEATGLVHEQTPNEASWDFDRLILLRLTRHPQQLEHCLQHGRELETVRARLEEAGLCSRLPSGASIFVYPEHYQAAKDAVAKLTLRPYHVITSETFLPLILESVQALPSALNVRVRNSQDIAYFGPGEAELAIVVEKTFLSDRRVLRNAQSVTQSTADVHGASNPRRCIG